MYKKPPVSNLTTVQSILSIRQDLTTRTKFEVQILKTIAAYLGEKYSKDVKLHNIIYLHDIDATRMGGTSRRAFALFRKLYGTENLQNVSIVTNKWDRVELQVGKDREKELSEKYFKDELKKGAKLLRHDGTKVSVNKLLRKFFDSSAVALHVQKELVIDQKRVFETEAGIHVENDLNELIKWAKEKGEEDSVIAPPLEWYLRDVEEIRKEKTLAKRTSPSEQYRHDMEVIHQSEKQSTPPQIPQGTPDERKSIFEAETSVPNLGVGDEDEEEEESTEKPKSLKKDQDIGPNSHEPNIRLAELFDIEEPENQKKGEDNLGIGQESRHADVKDTGETETKPENLKIGEHTLSTDSLSDELSIEADEISESQPDGQQDVSFANRSPGAEPVLILEIDALEEEEEDNPDRALHEECGEFTPEESSSAPSVVYPDRDPANINVPHAVSGVMNPSGWANLGVEEGNMAGALMSFPQQRLKASKKVDVQSKITDGEGYSSSRTYNNFWSCCRR
ncbi:hypothetical protein BDZ94DRAFT_589635 [Collybia nuda]|uniref:Uncharacterized protein n=1 Tax=Collybia nuda TaxID=64659 RepID=A0A9P5Y7U5_9AGAR|nr:hypothetical protein BDZ94DRAFT_589635 [Collybia nuda]